MRGERWSREEFILALNLYLKLPYGKMHKGNPQVQELARLMGRSVNTVSIRLSNFAACDPQLKARGIAGMEGGRKYCQPYWDEYENNKEGIIFESEQILARLQNTSIETKYNRVLSEIPKELKGETKVREVKVRVNQSVFRQMVIANYEGRCALTLIDLPELLVASHIIPWANNENERLNPENGICLSSLYDKAFDRGLITFDDDLRTIFSQRLKKQVSKPYYEECFKPLENRQIIIPSKYNPNPEFLQWHRDVIFEH